MTPSKPGGDELVRQRGNTFNFNTTNQLSQTFVNPFGQTMTFSNATIHST
jgi:hypothetical protein